MCARTKTAIRIKGLLVCAECALESRNKINVIIAGKHAAPRWLTIAEAGEQLAGGALRWAWASDDGARMWCSPPPATC